MVEVEWVDSAGRSDWHELDEASRLLERLACRSVGYMVIDNADGIVLTQGVGAMGLWLSSMAIPRSAIRNVTTLRRR